MSSLRLSQLGRSRIRLKIADAAALACVLILTGVFALRAVNWDIPPFEDAAILMRYTEHLAGGQGIVWNVNEAPVDGGTDFLFMVCVAVVRQIGFSLEVATRLVAIAAHFGTVGLIYAGLRRTQGSGIVAAVLSSLYFAVGPGLFLAGAYFGTPLFVLFVAAAWLLAQRIILGDARGTRDFLYFSAACLVAGLIRPEGVLIGIFMLAALAVTLPRSDLRRLTAVFGAVFVVAGGTYFAWRWHYFGYPLPNPFYAKGGGALYSDGLRESLRNSLILLFPFVPAFLLSMRSSKTLRLGVAFAIPIVGSVLMWVLLSSEMNFGGRFQYPALALGVLSWYPLVRSLRDELQLPTFASLSRGQATAVISAVGFCAAALLLAQARQSSEITYAKDDRYDAAVALKPFADRHYTMATTEAGLLPLYSNWRTIDTWGLNDQWIAHHGGITQDYLDQQRPDVIVFHAHTASPLGPRWARQIEVLRTYAESHDFELAAVFGKSPEDANYYYVRSNLPDRDQVMKALKSVNYSPVAK